jgi:hypothetical protein
MRGMSIMEMDFSRASWRGDENCCNILKPPNEETITGVASLALSVQEEIQSCAFVRKVHGDSFLRLGKTPAGDNHEKRNHHSFRSVRELTSITGSAVSGYTGGWKRLCSWMAKPGRTSVCEPRRQSQNWGGHSWSGTCSINWKTAFMDDDSLVASVQAWLKSADPEFHSAGIHIHIPRCRRKGQRWNVAFCS